MSPTNSNEQTLGTEKRSSGLNARAVLHAVNRRPGTLLMVAFLALGAGASIWFLLPLPKATAATVFQVSHQAPALIFQQSAEGRSDVNTYKASQAAAIKRRLILNETLKQPEVQYLPIVQKQPDALGWLDTALKVEVRPNSDYIRVSLEGDAPNDLLAILEALQKAYLKGVDAAENGGRRDRLKKLEDTNQKYRKDLERFHNNIDTIAISLGSKDGQMLAIISAQMNDSLKRAIDKEADFAAQVKAAQAELPKPPLRAEQVPPAELVPLMAAHIACLGGDPPAGPFDPSPEQVAEALTNDPGLMDLTVQVDKAQQALATTKLLFDDKNAPAVIKAEKAVQAAILKRGQYRDQIRSQIAGGLRKKNEQKAQERVAEMRARIESLERQQILAAEKIADIKSTIGKTNGNRLVLEGFQQQIGQTEKLSENIATETEKLKIEIAAGTQLRVAMVEPPYIVPGIEGNRQLKFTLMGTLGVLFIGFAGVIAWEYRYRRLTHTDDVTSALGMRLIGAVPVSGRDSQKGREAHPVLVEAIDATRTMLLNGAHDSDLRVLVVTSAVSGEGKTSLSGHLAISLARAGFRTLLIDGDLRAPTAHRVFDIPLAPGFCEFLQEAGAAPMTRPTGVPGLSVMTAGEWTLATRHALVGARWRVAKEQLKAEFDYVVVDTSPLLLVSDTLLVAREADGVVVSVLMGVSQVGLVDEAITRLQTVRANVTGVIANGVRSAAHEYTHGYAAKPGPVLAIGSGSLEKR
ncbi:hypothetical protein J8F10_36150 [Gemmata sp. G18]|uniref:CobQ/CobB/MinD/ParA nucleotide binding domain-containing protein n=1 Tax=Gemmata palustris TaxID=2822762 RepID=A0ABS5C3X8_9BACT|nr:CpsD/CapB family tyrosine-protein kinase [Gemmata palustris]MBP3960689.1 hypothetical protein [Gemmata palustris]